MHSKLLPEGSLRQFAADGAQPPSRRRGAVVKTDRPEWTGHDPGSISPGSARDSRVYPLGQERRRLSSDCSEERSNWRYPSSALRNTTTSIGSTIGPGRFSARTAAMPASNSLSSILIKD